MKCTILMFISVSKHLCLWCENWHFYTILNSKVIIGIKGIQKNITVGKFPGVYKWKKSAVTVTSLPSETLY